MKAKKKGMVLLFMMLTMLISISVSARTEAAAPKLDDTRFEFYHIKTVISHLIPIRGVTQESQITGLKSSNKKVATAGIEVWNDNIYLAIRTKKAGKTTISFNVKYGNKTKKLNCKVEVLKYSNPVATFKIGSTNYASKFKKDMSCHTMIEQTITQKVSVSPKAGFGIEEIYIVSNGKPKTVKNNSKVKLKKGDTLNVAFMNKKTKKFVTVSVFFD